MKIDRLIGIITILQQNKSVTAPYLAEKFEVSRRTINRDIEDICKAGIPIVTTQGRNGGISLMDGFALDTTVFTEQELSAIMIGLRTLDSVSDFSSAERLVQKIGGSTAIALSEYMKVDLASFYKEELASKIGPLKEAIKERKCVTFRYCYPKGEADKMIEPYFILYKWAGWYVYGFCREREDFRMYKLRRLWNLKVTNETYMVQKIPEEKMEFGSHMTDDYMVTAVFDPSVKYRLVEEYGVHSFAELENGRLLMKRGFTTPEQAVPWFLSFGDMVQVVGPSEMVERMKGVIDSIKNLYKT